MRTLSLSLIFLLILNVGFANTKLQKAAELFKNRDKSSLNAFDAAEIYAELASARNGLSMAKMKIKEAEAIYYYANFKVRGKKKIPFFERGYLAAQTAMKALQTGTLGLPLRPEFKRDLSEAYYWFGANKGKWGKTNGIGSSLRHWFGWFGAYSLKAHLHHMEKKLDDKVEDYGLYRVLGRAYQKIPREDKERAYAVLKMANAKTMTTFKIGAEEIKMSRNSTNVLYFLDIMAYIKEVKLSNGAKKDLSKEFCALYENFKKLNGASDKVLLAYNKLRLPETKTDLRDMLKHKEYNVLREYADSNCGGDF